MATTELRQRASASTSMPATTTSQSQLGGIHTSGLAAKSMIDSAPQQHGVVLKLHIPILFTILPEFLQNIILSFSFLSFLAPSWEQRYLILCGSFLYKFQDQVSTTPKGAPFDLETINVELVKNGRFPELGKLPPGYTSVFCVSTLRRKHYYAVVDEEEALLWSRCLKDARQEAITRNMGHAANVPYPQSWTYYDSLGRNLVKSKERIRERLDEYNMREMEMSTFSDGSIPRGFYG